MKAYLMRLARGQWPHRHETWAEYMAPDRSVPLVTLIAAAVAVVLVMVVLAEVLDRVPA